MRSDSPEISVLDSSHGDLKRRVHNPELPIYPQSGIVQSSLVHRRHATEPHVPSSQTPPSEHARAATDDIRITHPHVGQRSEPQRFVPTSPVPMSNPSLLRKAAPRAQVPVSIHEADGSVPDGIRVNLPSTVSNGVEDMTGVGASGFSPDVFYTTSPFGAVDSTGRPVSPAAPVPIHTSSGQRFVTPSNRPRNHLRPVSTRAKTPPLLVSNPPSPSSSPPRTTLIQQHKDAVAYSFPPGTNDSGHWKASEAPPLLGLGTFRDSAFSANSEITEVPIKWTGIGNGFPRNATEVDEQRPKLSTEKRVSSLGPVLPGGWQPTPIEEKPEENGGVTNTQFPATSSGDKNGGAKTPIHEVASRITSPEVSDPDARLRKSEAALVGVIAQTSPPPLPSQLESKDMDSPSSGRGQGWVLVNVGATEGTTVAAQPPSQSSSPLSPSSQVGRKQPTSEQATTSPQAKAIAIIDAIEANRGSDAASPVKKRFFGLGRKTSVGSFKVFLRRS